MPQLLIIIFAAALFDSISTMQQILIVIWLLATAKPVRNALWFLAGLSTVYILCGYFGCLALQQLNAFLHTYFAGASSMPDSQYYPTQLVSGLIFIIGSIMYFIYQLKRKGPPPPHPLIERLKHINPFAAFLLGGFISGSSFPFALPYLGVLEMLSQQGFQHLNILLCVVFYNLVYALPMLLVLGIYLFFQYHVDDIEKTLHLHAVKWNIVVNVLFFLGFGLVMTADSTVFLLTHHPLLAHKFM